MVKVSICPIMILYGFALPISHQLAQILVRDDIYQNLKPIHLEDVYKLKHEIWDIDYGNCII